MTNVCYCDSTVDSVYFNGEKVSKVYYNDCLVYNNECVTVNLYYHIWSCGCIYRESLKCRDDRCYYLKGCCLCSRNYIETSKSDSSFCVYISATSSSNVCFFKNYSIPLNCCSGYDNFSICSNNCVVCICRAMTCAPAQTISGTVTICKNGYLCAKTTFSTSVPAYCKDPSIGCGVQDNYSVNIFTCTFSF